MMSKTKISKGLIEDIIQSVTLIYRELNGGNASDYSEYDDYINDVKIGLNHHNTNEYARLGLEYILTAPSINFFEFEDPATFLKKGNLPSIIEYIYHKLFPDAELPSTPPPVELINIKTDEWRKKKEELNPHMSKQT